MIQDIQERLEFADSQWISAEAKWERYRSWWLNEYIMVKLLLGMVQDPEEVEIIAESSHARYEEYCSNSAM